MDASERPIWARGLDDVEWDLAVRGLFRVNAAAAYLGVSPKDIYRRIKSGLEAIRVGKHYLVRKERLDEILRGKTLE